MQERWDDLHKWQTMREDRARQAEEREQAMHYQIQAMPPLPQRAPPRPWEDLASVLVRSAQAMGYAHPRWILLPETVEYRVSAEALPLLRRKLDYELLGHLLSLDETTLHGLTLHRFATAIAGAGAADAANAQHVPQLSRLPQLSNTHRLFAYSGRAIQVCPRCLAEPHGYDRIYWRAAPVLLCSRHRVWLINACSTCRKPIPALRPQLCTCPFCGADYRLTVLPVDPQASWLHSTHHVFLTHLGIDALELGEAFAKDESSPLQEFPSHEYLWIVTQFLGLLGDRPFREELLPFLLRTLPVEVLMPATIQRSLLLLHYLLARWPIHLWIMLERLQQALEEDDLWSLPAYRPARELEAHLARVGSWYQETAGEQTMTFLRCFFDALEDYFRQHRQPKQRSASFGKRVIPAAPPLVHQMRFPTLEERVAPQPWEDLASVINRVAHNMGLPQADWLLISPDAPHRKVYSLEIPLLHRLADYQVLERQLGLDQRALYQLTLHRFAAHLQSPEKGARAVSSPSAEEAIGHPLLSHSAVRRVGISLRHIKLCPACVEEAPGYDRLFWRLRPVILCPRHSLLLIDRCPHCLEPIPGLRSTPDRCPSCQQGEFRRAQDRLIPSTSLLHESQTLLLHLLTAESTEDWSVPPAFVGSPILGVAPWQYFALLERFENLLQPGLSRSIVVQALKQLALDDTPIRTNSTLILVQAVQTVLFHFLLASWPENLMAVLDLVASLLKKQIGGLLYKHFWHADGLMQDIWSPPMHNSTPFSLLVQLFEKLHHWAIVWNGE